MAKRRGPGVLVSSLVAGAVAGAVAALLLAPKAGRETRNVVREKGGRYIGVIRERLRKNNSN